MVRGRRIQFTVDELREKVEKYFQEQEEKGLPFTVIGLCRALKVTRQTLLNYENEVTTFVSMSDDEVTEFLDIVKDAKMRIEEYNEQQLHMNRNPAGSIFVLKNFGWVDKQEVHNVNENLPSQNVMKELSKPELLKLVEALKNEDE